MNIPFSPLDAQPIIAIDLPVLYEDEGQEEMGETPWHALVLEIAAYALRAHFAQQPQRRIYTDLCLYYHRLDRYAYVSPDVMVCEPFDLQEQFSSYRIGENGPPPLLVVEVLSRRSFQQQDLTNKPWIYATMGVSEYLLLDPTGDFLPERLRLMQCGPDMNWTTQRDQGQGVVSRFDFRVTLEPNGYPRFRNGAGDPYRYPSEAEPAVQALEERNEALEERNEALEEERENARRHTAELERQLDELRRQLGQPPETTP